MQIVVAIAVLLIVMGGFFVISLSRKPGRELKKSCSGGACTTTGEKSSGSCGCTV
jgi:hypothetical protein